MSRCRRPDGPSARSRLSGLLLLGAAFHFCGGPALVGGPGLAEGPALAALIGPHPLGAQERPIVMIDPGHGGADAGVIDGELVEKDLVLRMAFAISAELVKNGYDVRLTRSGDYAVAWEDRRALAEEAGASLLLMLHLNQDEERVKHGAEVYAHLDNEASARAAAAVAEALEGAGSAVVVEPRPWPFLQSTTVPTVMVELAFLTHPVERRLIQSEAFHRQLGEVVVDAVRRMSAGARPLLRAPPTSPGSRSPASR